jgi:hypothetical protein
MKEGIFDGPQMDKLFDHQKLYRKKSLEGI